MSRSAAIALVSLACLATACSSAEGPEVSYISGAINAEDLVPIPGTAWIVGGGLDDQENFGRLTLIDRTAKTARLLFSGADPVVAKDRAGDPSCPGPIQPWQFGAHGIALRVNGPGKGTLYVVNHTGREAVELFNLDWSGKQPVAVWTGCIPLPKGVLSNGVAALPDERIAVTHMNAPEYFDSPAGRENIADWIPKFIKGETTGYAATWSLREGWQKVPGSEGSVPNGIAAAPDGSAIYVALWGNQELRRVPLGGDAVQTVKLDFMPDNLHWGDDGRLWMAGAVGDRAAYFACVATPGCHNDYRLASLDPATMRAETLPHPETRPAFGDATAAVKLDGEIYVGSNPARQIAVFRTAK